MSSKNKVLIVEDDPLLSIVEEKLVSMLGYDVAGKATSGEEALNRFFDIDPTIILMDIQLSGDLNGLQTVKSLRDKQVQTPVVFLSGEDSDEIRKEAEKLGCIDFLLKPVSKQTLSKSLDKAEVSAMKSQYAA